MSSLGGVSRATWLAFVLCFAYFGCAASQMETPTTQLNATTLLPAVCVATFSFPSARIDLTFCAHYAAYGCCNAASDRVAALSVELLEGSCGPLGPWCKEQLTLLSCSVCAPSATFDSASLRFVCPRFATKVYNACLFDKLAWGPTGDCTRVADMFYTKEQFMNALQLNVSRDNGACFSASASLDAVRASMLAFLATLTLMLFVRR